MTLTVHGAADLEALRPMIGSELLQRLRSRRHLCAALPDGMLLLKFPVQDDDRRRNRAPADLHLPRPGADAALYRRRPLRRSDAGAGSVPAAQALCRFLEALTEGDCGRRSNASKAAVTDLEDALLTARRVSRATGGPHRGLPPFAAAPQALL